MHAPAFSTLKLSFHVASVTSCIWSLSGDAPEPGHQSARICPRNHLATAAAKAALRRKSGSEKTSSAVPSASIFCGPRFSVRSPVKLLAPGPPFNQIKVGVSGVNTSSSLLLLFPYLLLLPLLLKISEAVTLTYSSFVFSLSVATLQTDCDFEPQNCSFASRRQEMKSYHALGERGGPTNKPAKYVHQVYQESNIEILNIMILKT